MVIVTKDVNVILIDMPTGKNEVVTPNEDGSYTLFINARLSYNGQLNAYRHGMRHIEHDDFDKYDVDRIEYSAHNLQASSKCESIPATEYEFRLKKLRQRKKQIEKEFKLNSFYFILLLLQNLLLHLQQSFLQQC